MCMIQKFEDILALDLANQIVFKLDNINTTDIKNNEGNNNVIDITNFLGGSCFEAAMGYTPGSEQMIREDLINM